MRLPIFSVVRALGILLAVATPLASQIAPQLQPPLSAPLIPPAPPAKPKPSHRKSAQEKALPQPAIEIPVTPLGFAPPAPYYLGDRITQLSLNFLDEDTLLFTFRVPGLIPREPDSPSATPAPSPDSAPKHDASHEARNIRALVLALPSGHVTAQALWRIHDFAQYLWVLDGRRFLLRDRETVQIGDADLHLTPFLRFPGHVSFLEIDPTQHLLVANTTEVPAPESASATPAGPGSGADAGSNPASSTSFSLKGHVTPDRDKTPATQNLLRILRLEDRSVLVFSRVAGIAHVPIDGDGYYEALRGSGSYWDILYTRFVGESTHLMSIESECYPSLTVPAPAIVLASACTDLGSHRLVAMARAWGPNKNRIWDMPIPSSYVWPLETHASDALRMARATLEVNHPITATTPLDSSDIRTQSIEVYDLSSGKVELSLPVSPILDGGGNFALSPNGSRFAVLNAGQIQIYDLPPAPPLPPVAPPQPTKTAPKAEPKRSTQP